MPNVKPAWLTLCIFTIRTLWNATGGVYIYSEQKKTLSYAMSQVVAGGVARAGAGAAVGLIMLIADRDNKRLVKLDEHGNTIAVFLAPISKVLPDNLN